MTLVSPFIRPPEEAEIRRRLGGSRQRRLFAASAVAGAQHVGSAIPATPAPRSDAQLSSERVERIGTGTSAFLDLAKRYRVADADVHATSIIRTIISQTNILPRTKRCYVSAHLRLSSYFY